MVIVNSEKWKDALRHCYPCNEEIDDINKFKTTPMRQIIKKMPG